VISCIAIFIVFLGMFIGYLKGDTNLIIMNGFLMLNIALWNLILQISEITWHP
jgi:hypothetical protein